MEKNKLLNLIAGIVGAASFCMPTAVFRSYSYWIWGLGVHSLEPEKSFNIFEEVKPDSLGGASLTIISGVLIMAGAAVFLLTLLPKIQVPLFTMLGWIISLAGCGLFIIFGTTVSIDGILFEETGFTPVGMLLAFASGGIGLVSWILQLPKK